MTLDQSLADLAVCKSQFIWGLTGLGSIRGRSPAYPNLFCPWTALALMKTGRVYQLSRSWYSAKLFDTADDTYRLERAADRSYAIGDHATAALRVRLLACLGLEEIPHE